MAQIADWLIQYEKSRAIHADIMDRLAQGVVEQDAPDSPLNPDESTLLTLLEQWKQAVEQMDTPTLGAGAIAIREQLADLIRMNNEIGDGAGRVRDLIAAELRRRKTVSKSITAYKNISHQR